MIKNQLNEAEDYPPWDPTYTEVVNSRASKAEMIMLLAYQIIQLLKAISTSRFPPF